MCQVQIIPTPEHSDKPGTTSQYEPPEEISISSSIECTEIRMEPQTPEEIRASSQQKDKVTPTSNETNLDTASPPQTEQSGRAISSRYVLDRPARTVTPDADFLKSFDSATSILKEISQMKNSMTFQRERETQYRQSTSKDTPENLEKTETGKTEK